VGHLVGHGVGHADGHPDGHLIFWQKKLYFLGKCDINLLAGG
jgi:hypothetical protein